MKALIVKLGEDEGCPALVKIDGVIYQAMDCFGYNGSGVKKSEEAEIEFTVGVGDDDESWDDVFSGNPDQLKKLEKISGWSYKAYGEIINVNPIIVDCGSAQFEDVVDTHDPRCVGEFIAFTIRRLDVWCK